MKIKVHRISLREARSAVYVTDNGKDIEEERIVGVQYSHFDKGVVDDETGEFVPDPVGYFDVPEEKPHA